MLHGRFTLLLVAMLVCCLAGRSDAQQSYSTTGFSLDMHTDMQLFLINDLGEEQNRLVAVVLFPRSRSMDPPRTQRRRVDSLRMQREFAAAQANRWYMSAYDAEIDRDFRRMWIQGQEIEIPHADSAIVVMLRAAGDSLLLCQSAYVPSRLPDDFWGKRWTRGDTSLFVSPKHERQAALLREMFNNSVAVRAFVQSAAAGTGNCS